MLDSASLPLAPRRLRLCSCRQPPPPWRCSSSCQTAGGRVGTETGGRTLGSSAWSFHRGRRRARDSSCCWRNLARCRSAWAPLWIGYSGWSPETEPGPWFGSGSNTPQMPPPPPEPSWWCAAGFGPFPWSQTGCGRCAGVWPSGCSRCWWWPQGWGRRRRRHRYQRRDPSGSLARAEPLCTPNLQVQKRNKALNTGEKGGGQWGDVGWSVYVLLAWMSRTAADVVLLKVEYVSVTSYTFKQKYTGFVLNNVILWVHSDVEWTAALCPHEFLVENRVC